MRIPRRLPSCLLALSLAAAGASAAPRGGKQAPPPPAPPPAAPAPVAAPPPAPEPAPAPAPAPVAPPAEAPKPAVPPTALEPAVPGQETVALLAFTAADPALANTATAQAAQGLRDLRVFKVMDPETMAGLLGGEMLRQSTGCTDASCLAELAGAVGAKYYVSGSVNQVGETFTINVVLTDQRTAQNVDGVIRTEKALADVGPGVRAAAQRVMQKLLADKLGVLRLVVTETNADVKIDDVLVGTTPIAEQKLPMGPHKVSVEKAGFLAYRQEITVNANETSVITGTLVPNQEYIDGYRRRNLALRLGAAGGAGLALLAAGIGAGAYAAWWAVYVAALRDPSVENLLKPVPSAADFKSDVQPVAFVGLNILLGVVFLAPLAIPVGAIAAGVLWFFSEDPGRYSAYSQ